MKSSRSLLKYSLSLPLAVAPLVVALTLPSPAHAASDGSIGGAVTDKNTGERIGDAIVVLQCACLQGTLETNTNADGIYIFKNLPTGTYTVQVLHGQADVSKTTVLPRGEKFTANFSIDPQNEFIIVLDIDPKPVRSDTVVSTKLKMDDAIRIPFGDTGTGYSGVVDLSPTAGKDAAGPRLAGTSGAESKYTVDGHNVTSPTFGTVGASIVQEFIGSVEVLESGYDAEYGGASGGIVAARRVGGSNKFRGQAVIRVTPRFASPRLISATDESLRVASVPDIETEGVLLLSGPIIKDKLFFAVGVNPAYLKSTMIQSFYHREDRDGSGGYSACPYNNGDFDCAPGGNYIASTKFAEQRFNTNNIRFGYTGRLDWVINTKHRLILSGGGGPSFQRRSFRQPRGTEPSSFGTNPAESLGGASRIASGIVNGKFGTSMNNSTVVGLSYEGRALDETARAR